LNIGVVVILLSVDAVAAAAAIRLTHLLRFESGLFSNPIPAELCGPILLLTGFWWLLFAIRGMYLTPVALSRFDEVVRCFKAVVIGIFIVFLATFDVREPVTITRIFLLTYGLLVFIFISSGRVVVRILQRRLRRRGKGLWNAVIVGYNEVGRRLNHQLHYWPVWGFRVVGFIDHLPAQEEHLGVRVLGGIDDLPRVIETHRVQWILMAPDRQAHDALLEVFDRCSFLRVRFMIVASFYQMVVGLVRTVEIHGMPLVEVVPQLVPLHIRIIKRVVDLAAGLVVTPALFIITPLVALVIRLDSPGRIFYTQRRVGRGGREFTLIKYRSMIRDAEKQSGAVWAQRDDPRVTRVGRILRRTHLDELPQFINVLCGQMSLVGPRPERREFVEQFKDKVPLYERRQRIRPGITGWAQVRHKYDETLEDVIDKTRYDLFYVDHISLALDLKILIATVLKVIRGEGH